MHISSIDRTSWLRPVAIGSIVTVAHALYFDWSDVDIYVVIVGICVLSALKWPIPAALATGIILFATVAGHFAGPDFSNWPEAESIQVGQSWTSVRQNLGKPVHEAATFAAARQLAIGYSTPSPLRFRHRGPVAVFIRGEHTLWVFHDGERVIQTYIGGS
jgi:hypothetical protein